MNAILKRPLIVFLIFVSSCIGFSCSFFVNDSHPADDTYVIMLSMDGFRWDYADRVSTPNLDYIASRGVKAEYVIPAFPTKTFPNHYTMATGLYPDNHGIVNNNFYCPELDMTYRLGDRESVENPVFYGGEPIWVTAEKQGITTASYFWVGSETPVQGIQPTYWKRYQHDFAFESRIDTVLYWLQLPEEIRPRLITFYFDEPDSQGHFSGPDSPEVDRVVEKVDSLVGVLIQKLNALPVKDQINLIVVSDHGMTRTDAAKYINLSDYIDRDWFDFVQGGNPLYSLQPKEGKKEATLNALKGIDNLYVWETKDIPERLNYGNNPRTLDMIVLADSGWSVGWREPSGTYYSGGSHGWDNAQKDMHTIFYAMGPAFKKGHLHQPFELVDLYPMISHIMNLVPAPTDGKLERVDGMLNW
jgi:predicted AlkP superfamily pyrophosphatase or phosphodiesterase